MPENRYVSRGHFPPTDKAHGTATSQAMPWRCSPHLYRLCRLHFPRLRDLKRYRLLDLFRARNHFLNPRARVPFPRSTFGRCTMARRNLPISQPRKPAHFTHPTITLFPHVRSIHRLRALNTQNQPYFHSRAYYKALRLRGGKTPASLCLASSSWGHLWRFGVVLGRGLWGLGFVGVFIVLNLQVQ